MKNMSDSSYLSRLIIVFFGAGLIDMLLDFLNLKSHTTSLVIFIFTTALLSFLLYYRLKKIGLSHYWTFLALFPGIGLIFGFYLYFKECIETE
jgi:uncharacterized membrane protein YhaH (DUF805 family)